MASLLPTGGKSRTWFSYSVMLAVTLAVWLVIRSYGERLPQPPERGAGFGAIGLDHEGTLAHVLLALAVICLAARLVGGLLRRFLRQPPVIGEILAGLLLGPSLLGAIAPEAYAFLLPPATAPFLGILAKIGVVLFMFMVGLELDPKLLKGSTHSTLAVSHASIVAPFLLGSTLALFLYSEHATSDVSFTVFSLFLGISLSVTAFPVLARILADRDALHTPLGVSALACAAIDDVTAWSLLAIIVGIASAQVEQAAWTLLWVLLYVVAMFVVVRPLLLYLVRREEKIDGPPRRTALAVTFALLLFSAFATEAIGIHALFGAFLFGALIPHDARLSEQLRQSLGDVVVILLLPAFFAFTGMRTEIGLLASPTDWLICFAILTVATLGKFGGSAAAARFVGMSWRDASALGILMNTRGLMELIVLNLGLDLGVITPKIFTMMVLMALATTFMTAPILDLALGRRGFRREDPEIRGASA
jgi:Kef-type K+ transport system membrane component KefB